MSFVLILKKIVSLIITAVMFIGVGSNKTAPHTVKDEAECILNFTVLSDVHIEGNRVETYNNFGRILKDVKNNSFGSDALVFLGDNTMNGQDIESLLFYGEVLKVNPAKTILSAAGNHDFGNGDGDFDKLTDRYLGYNNAFFDADIEKPYYYKIINGSYFIFLASENNDNGIHYMTMTQEQLAFLGDVLDEAAADGAFAFVFAHHPIYETGMTGDDDALIRVLANREKVIYFAGHTHADIAQNWSFYNYRGIKCVNLPKATEGYEDGMGIGVQVEVYPGKTLVRFRSFYEGKWIEGYEREYF